MRRKTFLAMITTVLMLAATGAFAQTAATMPSADQSHPMMQPAANQRAKMDHSHGGMMTQGHGEMMTCGNTEGMHEAMKKKLTAMDSKLDGLVATMNEAKGSAKVDAMAAVINELVSQRKTMRDELMSMQPMMMSRMMDCMRGHMMSDSRRGAMGDMPEGMNGCGGRSSAMHHRSTKGQPSAKSSSEQENH